MALARIMRDVIGINGEQHRIGELIDIPIGHPLMTVGYALEMDSRFEPIICGCGRMFMDADTRDAHRDMDSCMAKLPETETSPKPKSTTKQAVTA